jgi:hypothetical protein
MSTVTLYGIDLPEQGQKLLASAVGAGERDHKAWVDLAKYMDKLGFNSTIVRSKYGDDKASHKQLTSLIVSGLPAATSNAMNKPAKSRTAKEKTLAELGQKRIGVYRVRLAKYLDEIQGVKPNRVNSGVEKTVGHKVAQKLAEVLNLLIKSEKLTGLPKGYRLSEHIGNLKNEYKAIAGESYKDSE